MSVDIMSHVWKHSKQSGNALLVLLAIADSANDEGLCYPGIRRIAKKARISERSTQRILSKLVEDKELVIRHGEGAKTKNGSTNLYFVPMTEVTPESPVTIGGVTDVSPHSREPVTPESPQGVTPESPKSSVEPSVKREPSEKEKDISLASNDTVSDILSQADLVVAEYVAQKPKRSKKPKEPLNIDPDYKKQIRDTFNAWGTQTEGIASMLLGLADGGEYGKYNLAEVMSLDELKEYHHWQSRTSDKGYRPKKAETVFNWIDQWRHTGDYQRWQRKQQPKPEPQVVKPDEIVREPEFEDADIVRRIWDEALARGENPALAALQYATKKLSANSTDLKERQQEARHANAADPEKA